MHGLLKRNLQEIYQAAHQTNESTLSLPLIANFSGTCLYQANHFRGRLWRAFYCLSAFLLRIELQQSCLYKAIQKTHTLFLKQLSLIQSHMSVYEIYLKRTGQGYSVKESDFFAARHAIIKWNRATGPFVELLLNRPCTALKALFECGLKSYSEDNGQSKPFLTTASKQALNFNRIINLEGINEGALPLAVFKKILKAKPLNSIDHKVLDQWIKQINGRAKAVSIINQGIVGIASYYMSNAKGNAAAALEGVLEDNGCKVFQHEDPVHMAWRRCLKNGDSIWFQGKQVVLGDELVHTTSLRDRMRVFALEGRADCVALVAQNRAALGVKNFRHSSGSCFGVSPVRIMEVAEDGCVALAERLQPLCAHPWKSSEGDVSVEDLKIVNPIVSLLQWLVKGHFTPAGFTPHALMLDKNNHLKALKPMSKEQFDFNALEDFVFTCAAGNRTIYQHMMTATGLLKHATAHFYYDMMATALKGDKLEAEDLGGIYKIGDAKVVDRGTELAKKVVALRQEICNKVRERLPTYSEGEVKRLYHLTGKVLMECHKQSQAVSIIWPSLEQDVVEGVLKKLTKGVKKA